MNKKEKFNRFIENAARSIEPISLGEIIKRQKDAIKEGTLESYSNFDR